MAETIRESLAGAISALERADYGLAREEILYALSTLNAAERARDGSRRIRDWDDATVADQLPKTLRPY